MDWTELDWKELDWTGPNWRLPAHVNNQQQSVQFQCINPTVNEQKARQDSHIKTSAPTDGDHKPHLHRPVNYWLQPATWRGYRDFPR